MLYCLFEFLRPWPGERPLRKLLLQRFLSERGEHFAERSVPFTGVPRAYCAVELSMADGGEPIDDQTVQQHRDRCGAFDGLPRPALWFLKSQVLFALPKCHLDRPALRVPVRNCDRIDRMLRAIKHFATASSRQRRPPTNAVLQATLRWRPHATVATQGRTI